ncbi:MAG: hypothetical protein KBD21_00070 [Candidatus Pacebacteria bacterium]|nr:hypothetical protein [Candidatus Paceibacterota bacterium]
MCDFVSWIERKGGVLYVTDDDLKRLPSRMHNDPLGQEAIRALYGLDISGVDRECRDFWNPEKFPTEIAAILEDPAKIVSTWGVMIGLHMQRDDLKYVVQNAPPWAIELVISQWIHMAVQRGFAGRAADVLEYAPNLSAEDRCRMIGVIEVQKDASCAAYALESAPNLSAEDRSRLIGVIEAEKETTCAADVLKYAQNLSAKDRCRLIGVIEAQKDARCAAYVLKYTPNLSAKDRSRLIGVIEAQKDAGRAAYMLESAPNLSAEDRSRLKAV